jgi:hypothetical protein
MEKTSQLGNLVREDTTRKLELGLVRERLGSHCVLVRVSQVDMKESEDDDDASYESGNWGEWGLGLVLVLRS